MGLPSLYPCLFILDGQGRAGDKMMGEHKQHSGYGGSFPGGGSIHARCQVAREWQRGQCRTDGPEESSEKK